MFLRISEDEAADIGPIIISSPTSGRLICAGPLSAVFRVIEVNELRCTCIVERQDLVSYEGPLPESDADLGGISGARVLRVGMLDYPLIGMVSSSCKVDGDLEIVQFGNLNRVRL